MTPCMYICGDDSTAASLQIRENRIRRPHGISDKSRGGGNGFAALSVEAPDNQLQTLPALKNQIPLIFKTGGEETESR